MNAYLIAYDLNKVGQRYEKLRTAIKAKFPTYWACLDSTFIVISAMSADQIRDFCHLALDSNDDLLVVELVKSSWATWGFQKNCTDWLQSNL